MLSQSGNRVTQSVTQAGNFMCSCILIEAQKKTEELLLVHGLLYLMVDQVSHVRSMYIMEMTQSRLRVPDLDQCFLDVVICITKT